MNHTLGDPFAIEVRHLFEQQKVFEDNGAPTVSEFWLSVTDRPASVVIAFLFSWTCFLDLSLPAKFHTCRDRTREEQVLFHSEEPQIRYSQQALPNACQHLCKCQQRKSVSLHLIAGLLRVET